MINCIIIDDEQEACDRLESLLQKVDGITVLSKETKAEDGIKAVTELLPDLVFLDIEMPGKIGFDIVSDIRKQNLSPTFIFVTGYDQYAIKAIRSAAFDYLLKPVDIDELREAIDRFTRLHKGLTLPGILKAEYSLSDREIEITKYLLEGKSSREISEILFISKNTIDTHRRNILAKMGVRSTAELVAVVNRLS